MHYGPMMNFWFNTISYQTASGLPATPESSKMGAAKPGNTSDYFY
jgi:hypothetical protein